MLTVLSKKDIKIFECLLGSLVFLVLFFPLVSSAVFTKQINYQGKLTDASGVAVADGNYSIEFKLYAASSGGSALWTETQTVSVTGGLFSTMLGSVTSLDAFDFNQALYLTLNVEGDGEMTPRKTIGSVPNAFNAEKFDGLATTSFAVLSADNIFTGLNTFSATTTLATTTLAYDTWIGSNLTNKSIQFSDYLFSNGSFLDGSSVNLIKSLNDSGYSLIAEDTVAALSIGNINPAFYWLSDSSSDYAYAQFATSTGILTLAGADSYLLDDKVEISGGDPTLVSELTTLPYSATGGHSVEMKIVGNYLYMSFAIDGAGNQFRILDISDPANPEILGGADLSLPGQARGLDVVGRYAYVGFEASVFPGDDVFRIIDISDPTNPVVVGGEALTFDNSVRSIKVVGKYAYLGIYQFNGTLNKSLDIIDISDPYNPRKVSPTTISGLTAEVRSLDVVGKYAYLVSYFDDDLPGSESTNIMRIVDISNPSSPVVVGGSSLTLPNYARQIEVVGRYAYVTFDAFGPPIDNGLLTSQFFRIIDISDPTSPVVVGGESLPFANEFEPNGGMKMMFIADNLVYSVGNSETNNDTFYVIDVEEADNPSLLKSFNTDSGGSSVGIWGIAVSGNYVYLGLSANTTNVDTQVGLRVMDLRGLETGSANINSLKVGSLNVSSDLIIGGDIQANGLSTGVGGIETDGILSINGTTTASYFGGSLGVGTTSPISKLSVVGTTTLSVDSTYWQTSKFFMNGYGDIPLLLAHGASTTDPTTTYDFGAISNGLYLVNNDGADNLPLTFFQVDAAGDAVSGGSLVFDFGSSYFTSDANFNPSDNNTLDLGSPDLSWRGIYASTSISLGSLDTNGPVYSNNGSLTNVNPSSRDYKDNITDATLNIDALLGLQIKSFVWKTNGQNDFGLIAEEIRDVLPELYVDDGVTKGYRSGQLPFYLLQIAQRQEQKIAELDTRIASGTVAVATSSTETLNLQAIQSISGNWSISEDGTLIAKNIKAENAIIENGVTVRDRATGDYSCIFVEGGTVKTSSGECQPGVSSILPSSGGGISSGEEESEPVATSTEDEVVATTTEPVAAEPDPAPDDLPSSGPEEEAPAPDPAPPVVIPEETSSPAE